MSAPDFGALPVGTVLRRSVYPPSHPRYGMAGGSWETVEIVRVDRASYQTTGAKVSKRDGDRWGVVIVPG